MAKEMAAATAALHTFSVIPLQKSPQSAVEPPFSFAALPASFLSLYA
jgi:hypothetical protein